jgi:hypothetical protein
VVPPLTGVAVNVTLVPEHTGLAEGEIEIPATASALTDIVKVLDVAGLPDGQGTFEVKTHMTASLFTGT